jgi:pyruvate dehydrogenase (quinone)/pyruvate oxidase
MATAHAKATGQIGVCLASSGPGGIHLLNGLYDAKLDHMPVLAITGMQETCPRWWISRCARPTPGAGRPI